MSDDLISRQAALRELHLLAIEALRKQRHDYNALITICSNKLRDLPAIQPEQKTGRWSKQMRFDVLFDDGYGGKKVGYICSACRKYAPFKGNYCGNCGAKMESEV